MARETLFPDVVDYINPELVHGNVQLTAANAELVQVGWGDGVWGDGRSKWAARMLPGG